MRDRAGGPARPAAVAWAGWFRCAACHASYLAAVDERATLTQARSMLMLLLATCKQTQIALEAAANALDTDLTTHLGTMIERSEQELVVLNEKIAALPR